jgi:hypothetical protein
MTSFEMAAWPATMTAFVLELAGIVPPLDPRIRRTIVEDRPTARLAESLAAETFISSITLSDGENPPFDTPTVLLFSAESWEISRSSVGVVPAERRDPTAATWHEAVPTADDGYLLLPNTGRPRAVSFYRVTPHDARSAHAYRVGTVFRSTYGDVVWEDDDDRCHLIRYLNGALRCVELDCADSCGGGVQVDADTGIEHLPCGCPR